MSTNLRVAIHLLTQSGSPLDAVPSGDEMKLSERIVSILQDFELRRLGIDEVEMWRNCSLHTMPVLFRALCIVGVEGISQLFHIFHLILHMWNTASFFTRCRPGICSENIIQQQSLYQKRSDCAFPCKFDIRESAKSIHAGESNPRRHDIKKYFYHSAIQLIPLTAPPCWGRHCGPLAATYF